MSDEVGDRSKVSTYQRRLAGGGPQLRRNEQEMPSAQPLGLLQPVETRQEPIPSLQVTVDPNTGQKNAPLTIEQAIVRALANSPEIRIVSFDPEIARQEVAKAAGDFDPVSFGRYNYGRQDNPVNSFFDPGESETRLYEVGVKQRTILGSEWSASYGLSRVWDDLSLHTLSTRYEPMVVFELRQPLLRDAGTQVNLAGVDIAKLNYEAAMLGFREKAEAVCAAVITAYWRLVQARRDIQIQRELVSQTNETLKKVEGRRDIDATDVQTEQVAAYARSREAILLELEKQAIDAQDALTRLISDPHVNLGSELTILPTSEPQVIRELPQSVILADRTLAVAMQRNPGIQRAQLGIQVAQINLDVAKNQEMPRLDLVGSARARSLAEDLYDAQDQIDNGQYTSYAIGLTLEYPLGNRSRRAESLRRQWERRKATAVYHNAADQVAVQVREKARRVQTSFEQLKAQKEAVQAARMHLQTLGESEPIREKLTPEFLLVKLQGQETYAQAQRAETSALAELNIALAELAQAAGTILDLRTVEASLSCVVERLPEVESPEQEPDQQTRREPPWEMSPSF
ncbi:MAG: TolC family protein [Sedimentisphaerales bacterium]|nr:TolC family protein [Sedimentisphaerales bacterium]